MPKNFTLGGAAATILQLSSIAAAQRADGQFWPCNPIKNATGSCAPNPGLAHSSYTIDFTQQTDIPDDWTISNYATINFGELGAEFTYNKRYDAPQLWTNFFILFGRVDVEMRIANGTGMISSAVLMSDDFDEIDFEFSGNNFGNLEWTAGKGQNNYFGKGLTGNYDRGRYFDVSNPQETFHTYSVDWAPDRLSWLLDGRLLRTFTYASSSGDKGDYQYPQTPSKFQLGIWAGGDPGQNSGTKSWAGGTTNVTGGPYTMYVRKVSIQNMYPAAAYNWTDQSGKWQSIQLLQEEQPVGNGTNATITPIAAGGNATLTESSSLTSMSSSSTTSKISSSTVKPSSTTTSKSSTTSKPITTTKPSTTLATPTAIKPAISSTTCTTSTKKSTSISTSKAVTTSTKKVGTSSKPGASTTCTTTRIARDWQCSGWGWGRFGSNDHDDGKGWGRGGGGRKQRR
ncbi:hypothetical protein AC579_9924 [Pseudocercospora musae]|uniref:GH16 domain-containing protein n=1 Tax=Pseudocercospora musae TaxID=113226 RepID=A0A139I3H5_9PEZI|nr:hypothetical protein AC579_9924 [Pseudocercospora musae]KXT09280.1 hypothetical protein AC579_9924 [Pseudocercospora musae]KXT09282.1 hypothetical protein AC579_9924 [Pseudocercospora musae]